MADYTRKYDEELTIKKSDRFLLEIPAEELESKKAKILRAIDNFHCTLPQIKRQGGFEAREDLTDVFTVLEAEGVIVRQYNGTLTAFFRPEKVPTKFWLIGNDQIGVDYTPLPEPDKSKIGQVVKVEEVAGQVPILSKQKLKFDVWTADYIKELAEFGLSREEAAQKAGVSLTLLVQNLNNPNLKKAWDEGRRNYGLGLVQQVEVVEEMPAEISLEPPVSKELLEAPEASDNTHKNNGFAYQLEKAAQYSRTQEETASKLKMTVRGLNQRMKRHPELREAYNRGRAKYKNYLETKNNKENSKEMAFAKIDVSAADIEFHASQAPFVKEGDAQKYVAEKVGIDWSTLWKKFGNDPSLKKSYERGREQYHLSQKLNEPSQLDDAIKEFETTNGTAKMGRTAIEISESEVEQFAAQAVDLTKIKAYEFVAKKLGMGYSTLTSRLTKNANLREAFERGLAKSQQNRPEPEVENKPIENGTNEVKVLDVIKKSKNTVSSISDFTGLDRHYVIPALQNLMRENLVVKDIPEVGGDPVYSFIKAEAPKAEIKPTEVSNPEDIKIGIDAGRGESFTETFESQMLPCEVEFHRKLDEVFEEETKVAEPAFQDEKLIVENTFIDGPGTNGAGKNAIIETIQNKPQSVEAFVVSGSRHSELLEKIKPENPINTIAAKKSIETPNFSGGILGKQASYSSETIDFGEAGDIILSADLNIFKLDKDSRDFVMGLVTSVQEFNAKRAER
jgi:hypothetical protein